MSNPYKPTNMPATDRVYSLFEIPPEVLDQLAEYHRRKTELITFLAGREHLQRLLVAHGELTEEQRKSISQFVWALQQNNPGT